MAILLALLAAAGWGSSDYAAGVASRRSSVLSVVVLTHLTAALLLVGVAAGPELWGQLALTLHHLPATDGGRARITLDLLLPVAGPHLAPASDLLWGAASGISGGLGAVLLFRGLARGSVSVVAPITAVVAAVLPVGAGLLTGEQLGAIGLGAVLLALVSVVMISEPASAPPRHARPAVRFAVFRRAASGVVRPGAVRRPRPVHARPDRHPDRRPDRHPGTRRSGRSQPVGRRRRGRVAFGAGWRHRLGQPGMTDALGSGVGFGGFYLLLGQTGGEAGLWPILSARTASVVLFAAAALLSRERLLPGRADRRTVLAAGLLDAAAAALFLAATRQGLLSVVAVLASLYPAATIALARVFDQERCSRNQLAGLGLAAVSVGVLAVS